MDRSHDQPCVVMMTSPMLTTTAAKCNRVRSVTSLALDFDLVEYVSGGENTIINKRLPSIDITCRTDGGSRRVNHTLQLPVTVSIERNVKCLVLEKDLREV